INVGQESTPHTINQTPLELAWKTEIQSRLGLEIRQQESVIHTHGDVQFTASDLDNMLCLNAVIKGKCALRYHCVAAQVFHMASQDCTVPLSRPSRMESGELMHDVLVPKGTRVIAICRRIQSACAFHFFCPEYLGEDAEVSNPNLPCTFLYALLTSAPLTSGGGLRTCPVNRYMICTVTFFMQSVIETQVFPVEITQVPEKTRRIRRESRLVMVPTVEGETTRGFHLPLAISVVPRNADK
ncbi:hypothetical protein EDD16DRAFT_1481001, partial [Pisolithus croceorrhizus]